MHAVFERNRKWGMYSFKYLKERRRIANAYTGAYVDPNKERLFY